MSDKLILKNNSEITIESGASLSNIGVVSETKDDMITTWDLILLLLNIKTLSLKMKLLLFRMTELFLHTLI